MKATSLSLLALAFATVVHGAGKELTGTYLPADTTCPSPEEARAKMTVPEGYRVECFAHEPMVQNPVAMTWDTRGRLWVVEAYEYPNGTELPVEKRPFGQEAKNDHYHPVPPQCIAPSEISDLKSQIPRDRVIILEDTDNDGVADKRTVFVEGLDLASAIICGDDGIYVGQQPHLIHFRDADHDDKPEQWRVVLTGFGREDTHELVNSFTWGPDGWLYMTHGVFTHSAVRRPGQPEKEGFKFDAGIGRCRPTAQGKEAPWEFEVFADGTSNPWGCDYDARGNFFVSACVIDHFFHMAPGGIYVRQGGAPENPYAYEQLPSIVKHKHFRAAYAGIQIYQGGVYPQDTWGHAFIGNIHDNAIHEEVLTPVGSTFKCEPRRDFLRANNGWFRPVSTQTGPDGNLWVMDWCDKYPCYQNAKANPEGVDRERGRIWRVVYAANAGTETSASTSSDAPGTSKTGNDHLNIGKITSKTGGDLLNGGKATSNTGSDHLNVGKGTSKTGSDHLNGGKATSKTSNDHPNVGKATAKISSPLPAAGSQAGTTPTASLPADHSRPEKDMDLAKLATPELVKLLEHPNNWMRRKARRVFIERWDGEWSATTKAPPHVDFIPNSSLESDDPVAAMEAAWTLTACADITGEALQVMASAQNSGLPEWAARICGLYPDGVTTRTAFDPRTGKGGGSVSAQTLPVLEKLASHKNPAVRLSVAVALRQAVSSKLTVTQVAPRVSAGGSDVNRVLSTWDSVACASKADEDAPLSMLIWQTFEPLVSTAAQQSIAQLSLTAPKAEPLSHALTHKSMRRLCDTRDAKNLDLCLDFLTRIKAHDVLLAHALDGLVKGQEGGVIKPTKDFSSLFSEFAKSDNADVRKQAKNLAMLWGDPAAIQSVAAELLDATLPEAQRLAALAALRRVRTDEARKAFAAVEAGVFDPGGVGLRSQSTETAKAPANEKPARDPSASGPGSQTPASAFALEVIRAAADLGDDSFPKTILAAWKTLPDNLRLAAYATLTSRADWTHQLLDHLAATKATANFPVSMRRQLNNANDPTIRQHANDVFGLWRESSDDLKALIAAKKKACLEGEPDLAQGKLLFTTTCAVCHVFHGGGQKVGPELIGSGRSNLDAILANVIDPNQIIGNGYENIIVTTKDNRTLMGRVTEDAPSHVKLLAIGGAEQVVPRDQIAKLENTHQSLMPMGFGGLPDDQFRNLIWYVLAPPEEGPLTADKKKALSTSIDAAPAKPKARNWRVIDWESVSLWNPKWKITAPEFEGTPNRIAEYHGRKNLLVMHPFEDKKTPSVLEQKLVIDTAHPRLKFAVASDDRGDWMAKVVVNGQVIKEVSVDHEKPRWKDVEIDLTNLAGKEATVRLEGHATGWAWEFSYWDQVRWE